MRFDSLGDEAQALSEEKRVANGARGVYCKDGNLAVALQTRRTITRNFDASQLSQDDGNLMVCTAGCSGLFGIEWFLWPAEAEMQVWFSLRWLRRLNQIVFQARLTSSRYGSFSGIFGSSEWCRGELRVAIRKVGNDVMSIRRDRLGGGAKAELVPISLFGDLTTACLR